ncbi:MAG: hypothetical protein COB14_05625 [Alphaproteobacteria bacterium]|nr:MAG: hypothetical protein COB14_05625 [Alphaproteobacteria bacterium]
MLNSQEKHLSSNGKAGNTADPSTPALDENVLTITSMNDIPNFGSEQYKGGIQENALPKEVINDILSLSPEQKSPLIGKPVNIDPETGRVDFPQTFRDILSSETLEYIDSFSQKFNAIGDWSAQFLIQSHLGTRQKAESFHPDSWCADVERQIRAFSSISDTPEGQQHETELLMTDGLDLKEVQNTFQHKGSYETLPEPYNNRILPIKSGDMVFIKGLGDGKNSILRDAFIHRAPPHKNSYPEEGKQRDTLIWQRQISFEQDFG